MSESIFRPTPISGFTEWLPETRLVEQRWQDRIRAACELHGFTNIETPSVEHLEALLSKGETSNEVYTLHRLHAADEEEAKYGLHFDLTVPLARYVAQHFNDLVFPLKRYQIQRVWRGERPQEGRYREFTQADLDVIGQDSVSLSFDIQLPRLAVEILTSLEIPPWTLRVNNRKILQGFYEGLGVENPVAVIRIMDKLDKIGSDTVLSTLMDELSLTRQQAELCLSLAEVRAHSSGELKAVHELGVHSELLDEGVQELTEMLAALEDLPAGQIIADLSIARGLDYYTGTVYEGTFNAWPEYGSIVAGGRYENLAKNFIRRNLPGVGISIGFTRIFAKLVAEGLLSTGPSTPAQVLVAVPSAEQQRVAEETARALRERGISTELYHAPDKMGKQLRYASRKGVPYVWFPPFRDGATHEVKNLATQEQVAADPATWATIM